MNRTEMTQLYANLDKLISDGALANKVIILFGANKTSDLTCSYLGSNGIEVHAIIDNFPAKSGKTISGVKVCTPLELFENHKEDRQNTVILIASVFYKEMKRSVYKYGFDDSHFIQTLYFAEYSVSLEAFQDGVDTVMEGFELYERIKKQYGDDVFIIVNPCPSIGDAVLIMSYLAEYVKQNIINNYIYVITGGASERVTKMFGHFEYVCLTQREVGSLVAIYAFMGMADVNVLSFTVPYTRIYRKFHNSGLLNWGDIIRGITMLLEPQARKTPFIKPAVHIAGFCEKNNIVKGKTAIIAAVAVQAESLPDTFWRLLVKKLSESGYCVKLNVAPNESVSVEGAEPLFTPLESFISVVEEAGVFIGLRSGICDLAGFADCKKVAVYPDINFLDFFGLEKIGLFDKGDENVEVVYSGDSKTVDMIMENVSFGG